MEYKKASFSSGIVALLLVIVMSFVSSGGRMYFAETDWEKVNNMNYSEGQQYLMAHSKSITRLESLRNALMYKAFWMSALADLLFYFLFGFMSCVLSQRLLQSNMSLKSDRADRAAL